MAAALDPDDVLHSTMGKANFQRITRLLISGGTSLLREIFDAIHPPSNLPTILSNPATKKLLIAAKLTKLQWDCLYPSPGVYGKSTDFDVTLLFRLLRTICNLIPPPTGWDALPASTDHSLTADLARVKYYRNSIYGHVNQGMEIKNDEFPSFWQEISEALVRIAGQISLTKKTAWQGAIDNLLNYPLTVEDEQNVQELERWYKSDREVKKSIELKTRRQDSVDVIETVRGEVKDIKDQLGQMHQLIDRLSSSAASSPSAGARLRLRIEALPSQDLQVAQGAAVVPVTSSQPQAVVTTGSAQQVLDLIAIKCFQKTEPSKREEWDSYRQYLEVMRKVFVDAQSEEYSAWRENFLKHPAPSEILARGPLAVEAYSRALLDGAGPVKRVPVMLIGQDRTGKTSLKKSLKGETFNPKERSTEGIETEPSYFKVSTEVWKTGQRNKDTKPDPNVFFEHQTARLIFESLKKGNTDCSDVEDEPSTIGTEPSLADSKVTEKETKETKKSEDHLFAQNLPEDIATLVETLLENDKEVENEDDIYSILWDFGGQSVYYATHPIFLTENAIYILACDLSRNPYERVSAPMKKGVYKDKEDTYSNKTGLDYLDFWMSSVYSLASPNATGQDTALSEKLPQVFLVCTHADKPYCKANSRKLALDIYGFLKTKVYGKHLFKDVFVVDNTKSGSDDECPEVMRLRGEVLAVAKKLLQMKKTIPLKWLKYEKILQLLSKERYKWIPIQKAKQIASKECGIDDDEQFRTLLNFLHDQRLLIHFNQTPELDSMVILDPQWLIDVFKKVITVTSYEDTEENVEELWRKLEETGILDERLLCHAWKHLSDNHETRKSLIAIMERFSLLCSWPCDGTNKQYLVPSMLMSPPTDDVLEHLASVQIPSLFVRFESGRVPPGLFSRLVLLFHQWSQEKWKSPVDPQLFNDFAMFHVRPDKGTSVTFLCHSSSVEIVFHNGNDAFVAVAGSYGSLDLNTTHAIHRQLTLVLECMRKEFCWLKHMKYEMCVCCPVCSQKGGLKCRAHDVRGCECLHLLSELQLQKCRFCTRPGVRGDIRIPIKMFAPWFEISDSPENRILLHQQQDVTGGAVNERSCISSAEEMKDQSIALPDGVIRSLQSESHAPEDVVVQLLESRQLNLAALANPELETKRWIRCLARNAKSENRMEVVRYLRTITPAGTTGPLLKEDLDVRCIPYEERKALTVKLSGGDEWKKLAERLKLSYDDIRFIDKRYTNPCDVVLCCIGSRRYLSVGEIYDELVECDLSGVADVL